MASVKAININPDPPVLPGIMKGEVVLDVKKPFKATKV